MVVKDIDKLIVLKSLEALKDNGRAGFIIGGHTFKDIKGKDRKLPLNERAFLSYLYKNYNVTRHANVDGKLYKSMGTTYPIRIIVIEGKRKEPLKSFSIKPEDIPYFDNLDDG